MGMMIDDAEEWLKIAAPIKALTQEEFETFIKAVNLAIDTMHKYQKIEQIYKGWFSDKDRTGADAYVRIGEVLKDGDYD